MNAPCNRARLWTIIVLFAFFVWQGTLVYALPSLLSHGHKMGKLPKGIGPCQPLIMSRDRVLLRPMQSNSAAQTVYIFDIRRQTYKAMRSYDFDQSADGMPTFRAWYATGATQINQPSPTSVTRALGFWNRHTAGEQFIDNPWARTSSKFSYQIWVFALPDLARKGRTPKNKQSLPASLVHTTLDVWFENSGDRRPKRLGTLPFIWGQDGWVEVGSLEKPKTLSEQVPYYDAPVQLQDQRLQNLLHPHTTLHRMFAMLPDGKHLCFVYRDVLWNLSIK